MFPKQALAICKRIIVGLSPANLRSILCSPQMPPAQTSKTPINAENGMGNMVPGLVSFIIPTRYRKKTESLERLTTPLYTLREVLRDIHKNVTVPFEIIVICNETEKKSFINFIETSPHITRYCRNSENMGVPRSWNMGAQMALGEYLCFVNDDVEIGPGAVERILTVLKTHDTCGLAGPAGGKWYRQEPGVSVGTDAIEEADQICGWFFMTPRRVFSEVGGIDVAYTPALMEEIDYAFAVRDKGYRCLVVPHLPIRHHHVGGASSTHLPITALGFSLFRDILTARNRAYFEKKWKNFWEK